jgi:hypothetical protein
MTVLPMARINLPEPNQGYCRRSVIVKCHSQTYPLVKEEAPFENTVSLGIKKNIVMGPSQAHNQ